MSGRYGRYTSVKLASLARSARPFPSQPGPPRGLLRLYRWLDLPHFFTAAIFLVLLITAIQPVTDPDFWWHLTTGDWILSHHAIPRHDLYTFTVPDHRWITHEWLSEVVMAGLFGLGKLPLVSLFFGALLAAGFVLVYRSIDRRVNFVVAGLSLVLGAAAANVIWGPRIQMVTFTLSALTLLWIKRFCEGKSRAIYLLPLVVLLWANLHAGFFIVYVFLGVALVAEAAKVVLHRPDALALGRLRALALVLLASLAAAIVNPNGWDIYLYPLQTVGSGVQQTLIVEWHSPNFQMAEIRIFEATIFLLLLGLAVARRVETRQLLLLLTGLGLALQSQRNLALFTVVAVPALADYGQQAWERLRPRLKRSGRPLPASGLMASVNGLVLVLLAALVMVQMLPSLVQRVDGKLVARDFPVKAADFLVQHPPPGHMLNVYGYGGYLIFRLFPQQPVFVYGDAAVTGDKLLEDYAHLQYLYPDQPQLLEHYGVNWVIFHSDDAIVTELRQDHNAPGHTGWFELHTFDKATVMMRDTPDNRAYATSALG